MRARYHRIPLCVCLCLALAGMPLGVSAWPRQKTTAASRTQSLFGMLTAPMSPVDVPPEIRSLLPAGSTVYILEHTRISPTGEYVVVYYPAPANDRGIHEFSPEIALIRSGKLERLFKYDDWGEVIAGYAVFKVQENREAFALCLTNQGDGAPSDFLIAAWTSSGYQAVFRDFGLSQSQIRIQPTTPVSFELWSPDRYPPGSSRCVWCPQIYRVTTYQWQHERFGKTGRSWCTKQPMDPGDMAVHPFAGRNSP